MAIAISEEGGARFLHFGSRWIQGAMRIARPYALELEYTRDMMMTLLFRSEPRWPQGVLLIGLGAGSLTKFLYRHRPQSLLTVVEIEPAVVTAASQFFKLPDESKRLTIEIGDGADYLANRDRRFDLILVDGFDAKGGAGTLDTRLFYCNCCARLSALGIFATNLLHRSRGVAPSVDRISEAFAGRALALPRCASGNTVALAATGAPVDVLLADLRTAANKLKRETGLNLLPKVASLVDTHARSGGGFVL